ncbi:MAG: hypothetical protein B7Z55_09230 [Planctomycetales bacterium 12-60-4]|nr:MAG: hypothetical protein B7Z55_09230 [Planctomycetales bacterium 12-60-4]
MYTNPLQFRLRPTNLLRGMMVERRTDRIQSPRIELAMSHEDLCITRMIVDRVGRGHTLVEIERAARIGKKRLADLARRANIRYKHMHPTPEQIETAIRAVVDHGMTYRAASKVHGISRTAVHRFVQQRREKFIDTAGALKVEKREWKCPIHGKLQVWPCIACAALQRRVASG